MEISDERLKEVIRVHEHPEDWPYGEEVACLDEKEEVALCAELLERRKADRWIPVSERVPAGRETVLLYFPYWCSQPFPAKLKYGRWVAEYILSESEEKPLFWRPLPAPQEVSNE